MTAEDVVAGGQAPAPKRKSGGVFAWFWRGSALREARAFRTQLPPAEQVALARALSAAELADRAFDPIDALRNGSSLGLSISLYREASYWALLAQSASHSGADLRALFDTVPTALLELAADGAESLARVRRVLVERNFVDTAELPPEMLPEEAAQARAFVHALLRQKLQPEQRIGQLLLQRGARLTGLALCLLGLGLGAWFGVARLRLTPDLAAGRPWRASTSPDKCRPAEHRCAGAHTDMFFTTAEEVNPWLEIDLGKPTTFNRVDITNRSDCCPDRAVPLVVEVSRDATSWREVSRREDTFGYWQAEFAAQTARYVRLRVTRRSILHLDKVAVRNGR